MPTVETKETDKGISLFSRAQRDSALTPGATPIDRATLDTVITRVTAKWKGDGQASVVTAGRFDDLPAPILAAAKEQGYDNTSTDERIPGVTYKGKVYLIHENITSEVLAEETLLHERVHQVLRGNAADKDGAQLRSALQSLYVRLGGGEGLVRAANEAGVDLKGLRKQASHTSLASRSVLAMEEFLAEIEGRRAYENLPKKALRLIGEFVGQLRAWLRANGFTALSKRLGVDLDAATLADLRHMLRGMREQAPGTGDTAVRFLRVWHGTPHRGIEETGFKFSRVGEDRVGADSGTPVDRRQKHSPEQLAKWAEERNQREWESVRRRIKENEANADAWSKAESAFWLASEEGSAVKQEMDRLLADKASDEAFKASAKVVSDAVRQEMEVATHLSPEQRDVNASLFARGISVLAAKMGMTPEEAFNRRRMRAVNGSGQQVAAQDYAQALASQPPKGWKHSVDGVDAAAMWEGKAEHQATFWTNLEGKLTHDAPALAGYSHSLDKSAVTHMQNRHGDAETEAKRGQLAITAADVSRIPEMVTAYDDARWQREDTGAKLVAFAKEVDGGVLVYLARVSDKRRNLAAVSMWKYQPGVDPSDALERALQEKAPQKAGLESTSRSLSVYETDARTKNSGEIIGESGEYNQSPFNGPEIATTPLAQDVTEIEVDGVMRPALNSNGQPIHATQEGMRNFLRWFGDSKVVDAQGRPLVVYHGTVADFDSFDNAKTGANDRGLWGRGHYFSAVSRNADSYALRQGDGARVIPAYVSIQNPLVLRTGSDLVTRLPDGTNTRELIGQNLDGAKMKAIALEGGHDGVIQIKPDGQIGDLVAFSPNQIKSATGNNGQFNPQDANILFSFAGPQSQTADSLSLFDARARITAGEDAEAVRQETGWHQGVDGKWRYEISDADAKLKRPYPSKGTAWGDVWLSLISQGKFSTVGDMLDHPALFAAYPSIATIPVSTKKGTGASYSVQSNQIDIGEDVPMYDVLNILLHEVQHGIQHVEGFATGGSPNGNVAAYQQQMNGKLMDMLAQSPKLEQAYEDWAKFQARIASGLEFDAKAAESVEDALLSQPNGTKAIDLHASLEGLADPNSAPSVMRDRYKRLAGEVEARNTQARQSLSALDRLAVPPSQTADVADGDVIVTFNGKVAENAPMPENAVSAQRESQGAPNVAGSPQSQFSRAQTVQQAPPENTWFDDLCTRCRTSRLT